MPAMTTLAINDGKATPSAHSFEPLTTNGRKASFVNRSSGIPYAYERLDIEIVEPKSATGAYRVLGTLTRPILATVAGIQTVVRTNRTNFDMNFSQQSTLDERKDDVALVANLLDDSSIRNAFQKLEPFY